ncbi:fructosamine kinase family protein [Amycolatopsis roodepoortensis]|uniref:fructosamine kinase family protein n=1 Tax=Amycolatopsis roodepoortensis TaxID=700274 RepID=UPI000F87D363|nr:fructosamine kinase family protein [Amycolatopsis roodepoortensis]RSN13606.1 fructosamine kinase [Streptomyces sp. WAC 05977]UUV31863.1 fructosamine kinase family protein [Amycolatopsis roodepoortensis]
MTQVSTPAEAATKITGRAVAGQRSLSSGVTEVVLDSGDTVVVKRGHARNAIPAEAAGLRWLGEPGAVRVPEVRGHDGEWLVTELVGGGRPTHHAAERLGRGLAELHAAGAPSFGAAPPDGPADAWIGLAPMENKRGDDWPAWYAEHRVLPYVRRAVDEGTLTGDEAAVIEQACARLPEVSEPPARLHGDLWNGNVLWGAVEASLIDPAAHGGHRETDLAMLQLFGCPLLDRVLAAYQEVAPLADGWTDRIGAHQLFPLLVHTVLFGRSYAGQAVAAAKAVGR